MCKRRRGTKMNHELNREVYELLIFFIFMKTTWASGYFVLYFILITSLQKGTMLTFATFMFQI